MEKTGGRMYSYTIHTGQIEKNILFSKPKMPSGICQGNGDLEQRRKAHKSKKELEYGISDNV